MANSSEIEKPKYVNNNPLHLAEERLFQSYMCGNMLEIYGVVLEVRATFGNDRADHIIESTISQFIGGYLNI